MTLLLNRLFMHWTDNYSDLIVYYQRHVVTSIARRDSCLVFVFQTTVSLET